MKRKKNRLLQICIIMAFILCACGNGNREENQTRIVNWTLPDASAFEEEYREEQNQTVSVPEKPVEQTYRWNPHGVFTYIYQNRDDTNGWSTALFKVSSVDYEKHCAVLTYTVKDNRGFLLAQNAGKNPKESDYTFESGGEKVAGLDETEDADGTRHVIIYISDNHYLEFTGKDRLEEAKYCFRDLTYRLKYEG